MGSQHSKKDGHSRKSVRSTRSRTSRRGSVSTDESLALSADSLDLIYIDDYYDNARYLKKLKQKEEEKRKEKEAKTKSDSALVSKGGNKNFKSSPQITTGSKSRSQATKKPESASTSKQGPPRATLSKQNSTPSKQVTIVPPPPRKLPSASLSAGDLPKRTSNSSVSRSEQIAQTSSWHGRLSPGGQPDVSVTDSGYVPQETQSLHPSLPIVTVEDTEAKPRSILTAKKPRASGSSAGSARRQHSFEVTSGDQPRFQSQQNPGETRARPQTYTSAGRPVAEPSKPEKKKKLVVRGLTNFVNTHKRETFIGGGGAHSGVGPGTSGGPGPALWKREFPSKSKFHPDNFIYDWGEGPMAPPRPISAMARCKKHGGRCNDCGLFTCDLCQSCRKCENDCVCPCPSGGKQAYANPYQSQSEAYQEIFGGDGWTKARKVLCDLTEKEKKSPVGGNASKKKQNWAKNNFYKSQIDVLNPYNIPSTNCPSVGALPHPVFQPPPICFPPPMFPLPFMPIMAMPPPPMLPYYPPPPMCPSYDQCYMPPQCPYAVSESFMPIPNY